MSAVLEANGLSSGYGGQPVIHDVDLCVNAGEVVCLLGPNGAGKTTTLLALSGEIPALEGGVQIDGKKTVDPLHKRARAGLSYVTEERSAFKGMTARDNLRCGGVAAQDAIALFPELEKRLGVRGGLLSGGEQQMLTLARALCRQPRLLLADELSLGLAPLVVDRLLRAVRQAADERGAGVLIVEQHARKALVYADRALVMTRGRIRMELPAAEARAQIDDIESHYLSGSAGEAAEATTPPGSDAAPAAGGDTKPAVAGATAPPSARAPSGNSGGPSA
jgi:branched-chain amino acid transport system ATP-binding protein